MKGKIIKGIGGFYYVHDRINCVYACKARGIFRRRGIRPVVGDDVEFTVTDEGDQEGNIDEILPRRNELIRPLSANIDQALVVFAAASPEPNLNLLDRFLVMMEVREIPVSVCFNKCDLAEEEKLEEYRTIYQSAGYPVYRISVKESRGIGEIRGFLRGKTTILAGPSGVGKSSLTNAVSPGADMEVGSISEKVQRGKHTTRHAELFCVEPETYLMDTPGFSSLMVENMEEKELKYDFPEFARYASGCRFGEDCMHIGEPVCGVKEAVREGKIAHSRYENYKLMVQEIKGRKRY
ncbi:MAG: ribosome small subunit-dependent GTPase A [Clostridiales bacterium]|nr:ribosome small subunit-dependent GTPase A [Clostridiales bacterium]